MCKILFCKKCTVSIFLLLIFKRIKTADIVENILSFLGYRAIFYQMNELLSVCLLIRVNVPLLVVTVT